MSEDANELKSTFSKISVGATNSRKFYKTQSIGRIKIMHLVRKACVAKMLEGKRLKNWSTTHGL